MLLNLDPSSLQSLTSYATYPHPLITLTDLGLSKRIDPDSPLITTRCGSEDYAAPEILMGEKYDGRETDAWALGVLLYALMEGRLPFDPLPGKPVRSRAVHRIARCDWVWVRFGDKWGEWDDEKGQGWEGARKVVEGLLQKHRRMKLDDVAEMDWVKNGIRVEGGIKRADVPCGEGDPS